MAQIQKPTLARGMRDFSAEEVFAREHIFNTIKSVYRKYGFQPLETPVIENLSVLTGKYGEEGDKLLFKVLNSGPYLDDIDSDALSSKDYKKITPAITEKGLRYDLTVPLARYVAMNAHLLNFPFKRYQIDKVWRADRPQKGRYREFYQCDGDVIGSYSMMYDAECILIFDEVLAKLDLPDFTIKINNRKILSGLAETWGFMDKFGDFAVAIDKWDKIGENGVVQELGSRGFTETQIHQVQHLFRLSGSIEDKLNTLDTWFVKNETGKKGITELREVLAFLAVAPIKKATLELDLKLARGLDYYTSTIFEVVLNEVQIGSIASGGRYDELTAGFGLPNMPGVGISFGAERVYDVLKQLNKLPETGQSNVQVLILNGASAKQSAGFELLGQLRTEDIAAEMYPSAEKPGKQFAYAEKKKIRYVISFDDDNSLSTLTLKNIETGDKQTVDINALLGVLKDKNIH